MTMNVRTLCLGILSLRDTTGYEIKKMVEEGIFSHFIDASYGSIYPALAQLLKEGMVQVRTEEGAQGRPPRKVYSITEEGRMAFAEAINTDPARDKFKSEFLFQMLFADRVDPAHLAVIYEAYLEEQEAELERLRSSRDELPDHPGARLVNDFGQTMLRTAIAFLKERQQEILQALTSDARGRETSLDKGGALEKGEATASKRESAS